MVPDQWTDRLSGLRTIDRQTYELNKEVDRDIDYEKYQMVKLAKRLIDKQIYRQTYRHTDKPINRHIHILLKTLHTQ